ncbi:unnamed protein product, partial [Staurois parvus]
ERQVSGPQAESGGRRTPRWSDRSRAPSGGATGQVSGPQAGRRAPDPQAEDRSRAPRRKRSLGSGHQVSPGPGEGGHRSPGTTVGSESTGMTAGTGSDIGSSDWTAGIGSPGIRSFGSTASTASSGKAVVSESTGMTAGTGADIESSGWTAGIGWLDSGHRVIWLASGHRVVWQGSGHRVTRHWIVWLDSGH